MIEIMVDVFHDKTLIAPLVRDREDDWNVSLRRVFDAKGHTDITVPFDETVTKTQFMHNDLSEVVREAQVRKIKEVDIRCLFRMTLNDEEYDQFERDEVIRLDVKYDVELLSYTTFDNQVIVLNDSVHRLEFTDYLRLQIRSSLAHKICQFTPSSTVTLRRK